MRLVGLIAVQERPLGSGEWDRVTVPAKPFKAVTLIVETALV